MNYELEILKWAFIKKNQKHFNGYTSTVLSGTCVCLDTDILKNILKPFQTVTYCLKTHDLYVSKSYFSLSVESIVIVTALSAIKG